MAEVICNTSPLQYLHQIGRLDLLPALAGAVVVPEAVLAELDAGRSLGVDLPKVQSLSWVTARAPVGRQALSLVTDLGPGEAQVLLLALEGGDATVIIDDALARRVAKSLRMRLTGTLGVLLQAKERGLLAAVAPELRRLQACGFRLAKHTHAAVLDMAGEL